MKKTKNIALFLFSLFSVQLLSGCTSQNSTDNNATINENKNTDINSVNDNTSIDSGNINLNSSADNPPSLQISSSCIGCGKCTRIDAAHFNFNNSTNKAIVANQENLDSSELKQAISSCPAKAISI